IEPHHLESGIHESERERKPHISHTDDPHSHFSSVNLPEKLLDSVIWQLRVFVRHLHPSRNHLGDPVPYARCTRSCAFAAPPELPFRGPYASDGAGSNCSVARCDRRRALPFQRNLLARSSSHIPVPTGSPMALATRFAPM